MDSRGQHTCVKNNKNTKLNDVVVSRGQHTWKNSFDLTGKILEAIFVIKIMHMICPKHLPADVLRRLDLGRQAAK